MDVDPATSSSSLPISAPSHQAPPSTSTDGKPKKFKLDPMSLLLPHEKKMYTSSSSAGGSSRGTSARSSPMPPATNQFDPSLSAPSLPVQQSHGGPSNRPSHWAYSQDHYKAMIQQQQQQQQQHSHRSRTGETSSHHSHYHQAPAQSMPLSPPASQVSSPPPSWGNMSPGWNSTDMANDQPSWDRHALGLIPTSSSLYSHQNGKARLEDWEIVETLGTGTFGRVLLVRQRPSYRPSPYHPIFPHLYQSHDPHLPSPVSTQHADGQLPHFAMKVLRKSEIVRLKQVEHINSERTILDKIRHPFIVELYATYQDSLNVYMLLSYIPGGELFSHLRRAGRFSADVTRFYLASIVLAIEYLHGQDIIYRDLKPENLLLDRVGYLHIADFGFAKIVGDRTFTLCGTPEYLAPEIVLSQGHGKAVDWWALGILAFEMLAGYPPFFDDHPLGIYEKILRNEVAFPAHIDPYAKDLIRGLLTTDRSKRLGNLRGGAKDVMKHAWFAGVDWGSLERKEIGAPIVPRVASMGDSQNFQRYPPPRPHELPGIFGQEYDPTEDQFEGLFQEFSFPRADDQNAEQVVDA